VVEFLASLSKHTDVADAEQAKVVKGMEFFALGSDAVDTACYACHEMKVKNDPGDLFKDGSSGIAPGAPDLTDYGSVEWLKAFIRNPGDKRFYGSRNAMPVFADQLSDDDITLVAEWLLHQWSEPKSSP